MGKERTLKIVFGLLVLISLVILTISTIFSVASQEKAEVMGDSDAFIREISTTNEGNLLYSEKVEPEVFDDVKEKGSAIVIVELDSSNIDFSSAEYTEKFLEWLRWIVAANQEAVLSQLSEEDFKLTHRYKIVNGFSGEVTASGLQKLIKHPLVKKIYVEKILYPVLEESVPLIGADRVWQIQGPLGPTTGQGQVVCVLDTGIDYTHPDLGGCTREQFLSGQCAKIPGGYDFYGTFNDPDPMDDNSHGTHVAGIVAANGGIRGVAPDAKLLAAKVCGYDIFGRLGCPSSDMIEGAEWCIDEGFGYGVSILTMSIGDGGEYNNANCPTWMDLSINNAYNFNLPFTIASGNEAHKNGISYPACSPNAISVGATYDANIGSQTWCVERDSQGNCIRTCPDSTTYADKVACFTNSASNIDLMAPGAIILSTVLSGNYGEKVGTSMATPHVAGTIALIKQYTENSLLVLQMLNILKNTGVPVTDPGNGLTFKRIDALAAINEIQGGQCTTPTDNMTITQNTLFCPGTYNLPNGVRIGAPGITLDCNGATLKGSGTGIGIGISLYGYNGVIVKNCTVKNYRKGIFLYSSNFSTIISNTAGSNEEDGIRLYVSNFNTLANNTATNNSVGLESGITLYSSNSNTLTSNRVNNNWFYGISIEYSRFNSLTKNSMSGNRYNFDVVGGGNTNTIDTTNTVDSRPIYYIVNGRNQVYDETTNAGYFACVNCYNITVKNLQLRKNGQGVLFWNTTNSYILNVIARDNFNGISLESYSKFNNHDILRTLKCAVS